VWLRCNLKRRVSFLHLFELGILIMIFVAEITVMVQTFAKDMRVRAVRIKGTGRLPEMSLSEGLKYHLFLSRVPPPGIEAPLAAVLVDASTPAHVRLSSC
jgi:hypothetical protein